LALVVLFSGCRRKKKSADAYGVFEATEITVSSESNGRLLEFDVEEGQVCQKGDILGYIDSAQTCLQIQQLESAIRATLASRPDIPSQLNTLQTQLQTLEREKERVSTLVEANAATTKQLDDVNAQIAIVKGQISATKSQLNTQSAAILENVEAQRFQVMQLQNALEKCTIKAPINGTILKKYIQPNELAFQGKPLFKIADVTNMSIKVYVTEDMLSDIRLGQKADIHIDTRDKKNDKVMEGTVRWISDKAEFTPKMIQTKKERVNMVYAVRISFKNDGSAKIGMPGDVNFK
jgi:HlyD family secretion protein